MKRIKILPDSVKQKIAAGEVVEGPFSIVKELIENSIDAGASKIDIQIFDSGLKKILIKDNGSGIYKEDVPIAIKEHSTSKIDDVYDIEKISSYGFRGEALSSISSIANLTILSRVEEEELGCKLVNFTDEVKITDYAGSTGTTIIVENLFFNIPARKKFLKARRTESRYIRETVLKTAIANYHISFTLDFDGKRHITLQSCNSPDERIEQVYGKETFSNLEKVTLSDLKVDVLGYLSKPAFLKASRSMQIVYINNRPVEYKYFGFILSRAYEAVAQKGKHPAAIIFITIDPQLIDVNIHPAKREVKLFDQKYIDSLIFHLAEKALNRDHHINRDLFVPAEKTEDEPVQLRLKENPYSEMNSSMETFQSHEDTSDIEEKIDENDTVKSVINDGEELYNILKNESANEIEADENENSFDSFSREWKIIGTAFDTYILAEEMDVLYLIDFHAAHERYLYDKLEVKYDLFDVQELLIPIVMDLSIQDHRLIIENDDIFSQFGFDIEDFSGNSIIIRSAPVLPGKRDTESVINYFIEMINSEREDEIDIKKNIIASIACHSARRGGDVISSNETELLLDFIFNGRLDRRCPHGRPYVYKLSKNDIERIFKRQ